VYKMRGRRINYVKILVITAVILVLAVVGWYVMDMHTVRTVYVEGNVHYTQEEIKAMVMEGPLGNNSLFLSMKYENRGVENVPFVDAMDVSILAPDTIKISVYEKALAGYVKYMDTYVYFDKDGYVVESSTVRTIGIPQVTGMELDYVVLGQPLPVKAEHENIFGRILDLTKLLNKYELSADKIYFHADSAITLYFKDAKVALGSEAERMEDKVMCLPQILPNLEGKSGTLQMETYSEKGDYTFKPD